MFYGGAVQVEAVFTFYGRLATGVKLMLNDDFAHTDLLKTGP